MINFGVQRLFIATELVDMRKSFDTLTDVVRYQMSENPLSGDAYIFVGKRKNRVKVLFWEESGFWLCAKRLEKGRFQWPLEVSGKEQSIQITRAQWQMLLEGIVVFRAKKLERYAR